jgi:hypothetical protein
MFVCLLGSMMLLILTTYLDDLLSMGDRDADDAVFKMQAREHVVKHSQAYKAMKLNFWDSSIHLVLTPP